MTARNSIVSFECSELRPAMDAWLMRAYAGVQSGPEHVMMHLSQCPACRREAALAWALLPDVDYVTIEPIPTRRLAFLSQTDTAP